jgi:pantothenate synthetase
MPLPIVRNADLTPAERAAAPALERLHAGAPVSEAEAEALAAAVLGKTRLIDNMAI